MTYTALALVGGTVTFMATSTFLSTAYYPQLWTFYTFAIALLWLQRDIDRRQLDQARSAEVCGGNLRIFPIAPADKYSNDD